MNDNKIYGGALVASVLGLLATAFTHPTGVHGTPSPAVIEHMLRLAIGVHALAIFSVWLTLFGLVGLSRRLGMGRPDVLAALSAYGMAVIAVVCAAVISGFASTELVRSMSGADETARRGLESLLAYSRHLNGGFAKVHAVASAIAIALWSVAMLRTRFSRVLGFVGFAAALGSLAVAFDGELHMDVHDLIHLILAQTIWLVWAGVLLLRRPAS